jgi:hypothetical protein
MIVLIRFLGVPSELLQLASDGLYFIPNDSSGLSEQCQIFLWPLDHDRAISGRAELE